jgi:ariadne-1
VVHGRALPASIPLSKCSLFHTRAHIATAEPSLIKLPAKRKREQMSDIELEDVEDYEAEEDGMDFDDDSGQGLAFDSDQDDDLGGQTGEDDYGGITFGDSQPRKSAQSDSEVDFAVLSNAEIAGMQSKEIDLVSEMTALSKEHAATLLRHFRWNRDRLIEKYISDPEGITTEAGIVNDPAYAPRYELAPDKFTCEICFDSGPQLETLALPCNHRFCRACYQEYVTRKIMQEAESRRVQCPGKCKLALDDKTVKFLVSDEVFARCVFEPFFAFF